MELAKKTCPYCSAIWTLRISDPLKCPRCWRTLEPTKKKVEGIVQVPPCENPAQPQGKHQLIEVEAK